MYSGTKSYLETTSLLLESILIPSFHWFQWEIVIWMSLQSWAKDERQRLQYRNHYTGKEQRSRSGQAADFCSMTLAPLVHIRFHSIKFCGVSTRSGKILPLVQGKSGTVIEIVPNSSISIFLKALANFMWAASISKFINIAACFDRASKFLIVSRFCFSSWLG